MRITYSAAVSRDGFIARLDGDVSWLEEMDIDPNDTGLAEFFASVDGLAMGRATYDFVFQYGSWPYEDKPTWVCTSKDIEALEGADVTAVSGVEEVVDAARSRGVKELWLVGGGKLASAFLDAGLINTLSLAEMPIELGEGIPLFANHKVEDLAVAERKEEQKKGFKQIDIQLLSS